MAGFGRRSTAEQVSEGADLCGRTAIVTGANTGIGWETARVLALHGAHVVMACRDPERARAGRERILSDTRIDAAHLELGELDLASQASIRAFADGFLASRRSLHLLVNNAGVMIPMRRETADGFEHHFGINHLGHFLLTCLLLDPLRAADAARVVCLSSSAMLFASLTKTLEDLNWEDRKYSGWRAYGQSKVSNLLFARALAGRLKPGQTANAVHPGGIKTNLGRHMSLFARLAFAPMTLLVLKSIPQGAATQCYVAVHPDAKKLNGEYLVDCNVAPPSPHGQDDGLGKKLWEKTEEIVAGLI
jgi:retinol dehydrogenase-12